MNSQNAIQEALEFGVTPDYVSDSINWPRHTVFVFGSNLKGVHGKGAAQTANLYWGAIRGHGEGRMGRAYAIPTKQAPYGRVLSIEDIEPYIQRFIEHVDSNPDNFFLISAIGCGLAGHRPDDVAPLFEPLEAYTNVSLPASFRVILQP